MPTPGAGPLQIGPLGTPLARPLGSSKQWSLVGTTINGAGDGIANVIVKLFDSATDTMLMQTISGAGGTFTFSPPHNAFTFWVYAYLPGSPDTFAVSVNTLTAV